MKFFDKSSFIGLIDDAKRADMGINDYVEMMTSDTKRSKYRTEWLNRRNKFTNFCSIIESDIINKIDSNKVAIIDIDNIIEIIIENHVSVKSLGIYSKKELMMGLYFYFKKINIDMSGGKYDGYVEFRYIGYE